MTPEAHEFHRRSVRLPGYDYARPGAYFVTLVTAGRRCLFGEIVDGEMVTNVLGNIIRQEWENLPRRFRFVDLGAFVVMPNHVHGIVIIRPSVGATRPDSNSAPYRGLPFIQTKTDGSEGSPLQPGPGSGSLGAIIAQFKPRVTRRIWKLPQMRGLLIWQRNYYEHVIRGEKDWERIHRYIESNPIMWDEDEENPEL